MDWVLKKIVSDMEPYFINGLNIWEQDWEFTDKYVDVIDPTYKKSYKFPIYKFKNDDKTLFVAGEFSQCIWGIYEKK